MLNSWLDKKIAVAVLAQVRSALQGGPQCAGGSAQARALHGMALVAPPSLRFGAQPLAGKKRTSGMALVAAPPLRFNAQSPSRKKAKTAPCLQGAAWLDKVEGAVQGLRPGPVKRTV